MPEFLLSPETEKRIREKLRQPTGSPIADDAIDKWLILSELYHAYCELDRKRSKTMPNAVPTPPTGTLAKQIARYMSQHSAIAALTPETKTFVATELALYVERAVDKFIKGQMQHGGNLTDRKLMVEIDQELIDLFWYTRGLREKLRNV